MNGITTTQVSDANTCRQNGMVLFQPRGPDEYDVGRNYITDDYGHPASNWDHNVDMRGGGPGGGIGPLGVHVSQNGESDGGNNVNFDAEEHRDIASPEYVNADDSLGTDGLYGNGTNGWKTMVSEKFWVSEEQDEGEPNGDYQANTWLGWQNYDNDGYVSNYNDIQDANYGYNTYLCSLPP